MNEVTETNNHRRRGGQKHTNMFVTINTNKTDKSLRPAFKAVSTQMFNNLSHYIRFLILNQTDDDIDSANVELAYEIGGKNHTIHWHAMIKIAHHSKIRVHIAELRDDIRKAMGIEERFHSDVQYFPGSTAEMNIKHYMRKGEIKKVI